MGRIFKEETKEKLKEKAKQLKEGTKQKLKEADFLARTKPDTTLTGKSDVSDHRRLLLIEHEQMTAEYENKYVSLVLDAAIEAVRRAAKRKFQTQETQVVAWKPQKKQVGHVEVNFDKGPRNVLFEWEADGLSFITMQISIEEVGIRLGLDVYVTHSIPEKLRWGGGAKLQKEFRQFWEIAWRDIEANVRRVKV